MYSGVIDRYYREKNSKDGFMLKKINDDTVTLGLFRPEQLFEVSKEDFQHWIDLRHNLYVRQVGEITLPFPYEDC